MENTTHITNATSDASHGHVKTTNPVLVYAVLVISTLIEIGITILPGFPRSIAVPMLLALSFVKASLVALYFMHLRYEKVIYGLVFVAPAAFAVFLISVLLSF
jgi:cytochrome c oxidase subunit IV